MNIIPSAVQSEIFDFVNVSHFKNCGEFLQHIPGTNQVKTINSSPVKLQYLKTFVINSIKEFQMRLNATCHVKKCGIGPTRVRNILGRVDDALTLARRSDNAQVLLEQCRMILTWKEECRKIHRFFAHLLAYHLYNKNIDHLIIHFGVWYCGKKFSRGEHAFHDWGGDKFSEYANDLAMIHELLSPIDVHNSVVEPNPYPNTCRNNWFRNERNGYGPKRLTNMLMSGV
jgi:hypothetical protein